MAAMDFPSSPTDGQVYGNYVYSTATGAWLANPQPQNVAVSSPTAPSSPTANTLWYNTQDGNTYIYYYDGNTYQWVQLKSDSTLSSTLGNRVTTLETYPSGLVPVVPTSVTLGSGTSSVGANGLVTFTGASNVALNGVFTSAYTNYRVMVNYSSFSANNDTFLRFRNAGTDSSTAYYYAGNTMNTAAAGGTWVANNQVFMHLGSNSSAYAIRSRHIVEIADPAVSTVPSKASWTSFHDNGTTWTHTHVSGAHLVNQAYDSVSVGVSSGNMTGTVQVYGYR